ncbi:angiopoietin-2 [Biomphalaria glabrata]|nr:angiopoietin-2 [Biomphalaria glabrata]
MNLLLRFVICAFIAKLSISELIIDVQPDVISPVLTSQLLVKMFCEQQPPLFVYNPTESDARVYRCNVEGETSFGKNISIVAKKTVEFRGNVTALVEEIRRLKTNYENDLCSLKRDELNSKNNQRSRLLFVSNSKVIKELIDSLTLTCSFQISDDISFEKATIQSMHILHESNGVIAMISGDQPIVRTGPDIISPSIKGELYHNISKVSFLQITWRNPTVLESGKYFCGAHVKISENKIDRLNRMLTIIVERPTIDDLFRIVLDFKKLADEQKQNLHDNEQKLKSIEEDLISNQQNLSIFRNETTKLVAELSNSQIEWKGQIDKALDNQVLFNSNTKVVLWQSL